MVVVLCFDFVKSLQSLLQCRWWLKLVLPGVAGHICGTGKSFYQQEIYQYDAITLTIEITATAIINRSSNNNNDNKNNNNNHNNIEYSLDSINFEICFSDLSYGSFDFNREIVNQIS